MSRIKELSLSDINKILEYVEDGFIGLQGNQYFELIERRYELEEIYNIVDRYDLNLFRYKREKGSIKIYSRDREELVESYSCYFFYCVEVFDELRIIKRSENYEMV